MRAGVPNAVARRLDPTQRYGLRLTLVAAATVLVTVPFASLLFEVVAKGPLTRLDARVANAMNDWVHESPSAVRVLDATSWLGKPLWLAIVVAAGAAYIFRRGRRRLACYLAATVIGGGLIDSAVKILVNRPRPLVDHPIATAFGKSFPSGHAMSATVAYGAILLSFLPAVPRRRRPFAIAGVVLLVLAIGGSRLLLGVHFVSDVAGGYVLGLAWLSCSTAVFEIWRDERGARKSTVLEEGVEPEAAVALRR